MIRRIIALMIKEFLALLKDKQSRVVLIVPPLIQLLVFGYAATFDLNHISYAVYNEDTGARPEFPIKPGGFAYLPPGRPVDRR